MFVLRLADGALTGNTVETLENYSHVNIERTDLQSTYFQINCLKSSTAVHVGCFTKLVARIRRLRYHYCDITYTFVFNSATIDIRAFYVVNRRISCKF